MRLCPGCERHLLGAERQCPFCGANVWVEAAPRPRLAMALLSLAVVSCTGEMSNSGDVGAYAYAGPTPDWSASDTQSTDSSTTDSWTGTSTSTTSETDSATDTGDSTDTGTTGAGSDTGTGTGGDTSTGPGPTSGQGG